MKRHRSFSRRGSPIYAAPSLSMNTRTLLTRHIDSTLTLAEAADRLARETQTNPALANLFLDPEVTLPLRVGGPELHGDLVFQDYPKDKSVLAHFRKGDRAVFNALVAALGDGWKVRRPQPRHTDGLDLLEFLQEGHRVGRCERLTIGDSALEDALGCAFDETELLIRLMVELEVSGEPGPVIDPEEGPKLEAVRQSLTGTDRVVLHRGRRVALKHRYTLQGRRNDIDLTVHYAWLPRSKTFLIGGFTETPSA